MSQDDLVIPFFLLIGLVVFGFPLWTAKRAGEKGDNGWAGIIFLLTLGGIGLIPTVFYWMITGVQEDIKIIKILLILLSIVWVGLMIYWSIR